MSTYHVPDVLATSSKSAFLSLIVDPDEEGLAADVLVLVLRVLAKVLVVLLHLQDSISLDLVVVSNFQAKVDGR